MKSFHAAAIQMNSQPDLELNLEQAYTLIKEASGKGALLVGLPENFAWLGDLQRRIKNAEKIARQVPGFLKDTAVEFGIYLLGGGFPVPAGEFNNKVYNRSLLIDPQGREAAVYDKIHLFDVDLPGDETYRESAFVSAGKKRSVTYSSDEIGVLGLSICYDLRFPELYRRLSDKGADLLCIPSAFTATTGKAHWEPLIRARAIENTTYVFAPAQAGVHGKHRETHGHAMIVDPWGIILADAGESPGVAMAEIDPKRIGEVRRRIPSLEHRVFRHE